MQHANEEGRKVSPEGADDQRRRKPWRKPIIISSEFAEAEAGAVATVSEGAFAYGS